MRDSLLTDAPAMPVKCSVRLRGAGAGSTTYASGVTAPVGVLSASVDF
jgi:hypothetical protein